MRTKFFALLAAAAGSGFFMSSAMALVFQGSVTVDEAVTGVADIGDTGTLTLEFAQPAGIDLDPGPAFAVLPGEVTVTLSVNGFVVINQDASLQNFNSNTGTSLGDSFRFSGSTSPVANVLITENLPDDVEIIDINTVGAEWQTANGSVLLSDELAGYLEILENDPLIEDENEFFYVSGRVRVPLLIDDDFDVLGFQPDFASFVLVPEPASLTVVCFGALALRRRRR